MKTQTSTSQGYMTVGEMAKKMGVSVRTLQYYDKNGLLSPSSESEGGRRLYTSKDMIKLHQILSLKSLGFSLSDIKNRLISLDSPADVTNALTEQAAAIREKMETLSEALNAIESLKTEVLQMQSVDFNKYADIIVNLQMNNDYYWLIKHLDDNVLDHLRSRFDKDGGISMKDKFTHLQKEAIRLYKNNVLPDSEIGQKFAKEFWDMVMEFTGGDMSMLSKLIETKNIDGPNKEWKLKQENANAFIEPALGAYFTALGYNPLEEEVR